MNDLREQQVLEVIQLMVQHCSCKPSLLCTLLQVSAQVNQALRQCRGQATVQLYVSQNYGVDTPCRPWAFGRCLAWLVKYGGLVSSLNIQRDTYAPSDPYAYWRHGDLARLDAIDELCQQLLDTYLQLAASLAETGAVGSVPGASAQGSHAGSASSSRGSPKNSTLLLEEFASEYRISSTALAALASFKVQHASIQYRAPCTSPAFCDAFGQLTTLKSLNLTGGSNECIPDQLAAVFSKLRGLTHFTCEALQTRNVPQLPAGLQFADVMWAPGGGDKFADLGFLTALKDLRMRDPHVHSSSVNRGRMDVVLPAQLTGLAVSVAVHVSGCDNLRQLHLQIHDYGKELDVLQGISRSTQLQELRVIAASTARSLSAKRLEQAAEAIKRMTHLTSLVFDIDGDAAATDLGAEDVVLMSTVPLCEAIAHLSKLRFLGLSVTSQLDYKNQADNTMSSKDLLNLSELTQLTTLKLNAPALNDFGAIALLAKLTGLQDLQLETRSVRSAGLIPVLANLSLLTSLELRILTSGCGDPYHDDYGYGRRRFQWERHELMRLSTLTKLRHLRVAPDSGYVNDLLEALNLSARAHHRQDCTCGKCGGRYGYDHDSDSLSRGSSPSNSGSESD